MPEEDLQPSHDRDTEFAMKAVEKGFITPVILPTVFRKLTEARVADQRASIGSILTKMGLMDKTQVKDVLQGLGTIALICSSPRCGKIYNVRAFDSSRNYKCKVCGSRLFPENPEDAGEIMRDDRAVTRKEALKSLLPSDSHLDAEPDPRKEPGKGPQASSSLADLPAKDDRSLENYGLAVPEEMLPDQPLRKVDIEGEYVPPPEDNGPAPWKQGERDDTGDPATSIRPVGEITREVISTPAPRTEPPPPPKDLNIKPEGGMAAAGARRRPQGGGGAAPESNLPGIIGKSASHPTNARGPKSPPNSMLGAPTVDAPAPPKLQRLSRSAAPGTPPLPNSSKEETPLAASVPTKKGSGGSAAAAVVFAILFIAAMGLAGFLYLQWEDAKQKLRDLKANAGNPMVPGDNQENATDSPPENAGTDPDAGTPTPADVIAAVQALRERLGAEEGSVVALLPEAEALLAEYPGDGRILRLLADLHALQGDYDTAQARYSDALEALASAGDEEAEIEHGRTALWAAFAMLLDDRARDLDKAARYADLGATVFPSTPAALACAAMQEYLSGAPAAAIARTQDNMNRAGGNWECQLVTGFLHCADGIPGLPPIGEEDRSLARSWLGEAGDDAGYVGLYLRGLLDVAEGDPITAQAPLRTLCELYYPRADICYHLANARFESGAVVQAQRTVEDLLAAHPNFGRAYILRGRVRLAQGQSSAARSDFATAVRRLPLDIDARLAIGDFHIQVGEFAEAVQVLGEGLQVFPNHPALLEQRGIARLRQSRPAPGDSEWRRVTVEMARADLEAALAERFSAVGLAALGTALWSTGQNQEAENAFAQAIEHNDRAPAPRIRRAEYLLSQGQYEAAMADLRVVLVRDRDNWEALLLKGRILAAQGDRNALDAFDGARRQLPAWYRPYYEIYRADAEEALGG